MMAIVIDRAEIWRDAVGIFLPCLAGGVALALLWILMTPRAWRPKWK
jgi:hypothetical protein